MRIRELIREIRTGALSQRVPTVLIFLLAALICLAAVLTVGRSVAAHHQLERRLEDAGTRSFTIVDVHGYGFLTPAVMNGIDSLSYVERAVAFTIAADAYNTYIGPGATPVASRFVNGDLTGLITLDAGRMPEPGEAIVTTDDARALGFDQPFGSITVRDGGREFPVVGAFSSPDSIPELDAILINAPDVQATVARVVVTRSDLVDQAMLAASGVISADDPRNLRFDSPVSIAQLRTQIVGDLQAYSASMLYGVLAGGAILSALIVFADVLGKRADLGRRMALGATRRIIVTFTVGKAALPAIFGSLVGAGVGLVAASRMGSSVPPSFAVGTGVLVCLVMMVSAAPGAVWAAAQDPVRVLRTP